MKFGKAVVKYRVPILIVSILLLIPAVLGALGTRINYDVLSYLPKDIETMKGQDILLDEFGKGGFSMVMLEGMEEKDVAALKKQIEGVDHVDSVIWYDSLMDISVPMELLPDDLYEAFNNGDSTMMVVFFDAATSSDETMEAVEQIRSLAGKQCFVSGLSAVVTDLKTLCQQEEVAYVIIAAVLTGIVLAVFMDSYLLPVLFLASIGMAILYNLGTNYFLGEVSYITKALAVVLQLGVTLDYSIFLWHSYQEQKQLCHDSQEAMARAIPGTLTSIVGSSITTVAGFLALCFMTFALGRDLGIVMAKGVVFGVLGCVTVLPALILIFDKGIEKTRHRPLLPKFDRLSDFIVKHNKVFLIAFVVLLIPALIGYAQTPVYYDLSGELPKDLECVIANTKLKDDFDISSTHMVLADAGMSSKDTKAMLKEMDEVDGVKFALGLDSLLGSSVPQEVLPESIESILKGDTYQLLLVNSEYSASSDEVNAQIGELNQILKKYDANGMLIGEAACMKDLIDITAHDFKVVDVISIVSIFLIILLVLKSVSLPVVLVAVIELAIFINLGIPYYTGMQLPFIAPICITTIQLGATVDYAILMTTRYIRERQNGHDKKEAVGIALRASIPSITVSGLGFFAATYGVALYSRVDMIGSMCRLMARGALVSVLCVVFILPSMFLLLDKLICRSTWGMRRLGRKQGQWEGELK